MMRKQSLWVACKILAIFFVFAFVLYMAKSRTVSYITVNRYVTSDVAYADGRTAHFDSKDFGRLDRNDVATLHLNLPEKPLMDRAMLVFYNYNAVTDVWFQGDLLDSYGTDIAEQGMMIGNHDFLVDVPDGAWGGEITIVVRATEDSAIANFTNLKLYPAGTAYRFYIDSDPVGFVVAIALFIFALMGLFACLMIGMRGTALKNGLCLAFTALLISL